MTNNQIKDTIIIIGSLENTGILSTGTTKKISQKGRLLNFLVPLTRFALP